MLDRHIQDGNDEFLNCNYSEYKEQYKEYPQAFVIGCYSPADHPTVLKIAGSSEDKATPEYTAELLNKRLTNLKSLYAAQVELHKEVHGRREFPRANRLN